MTEAEIIELVRGGEGINVEFKRSATAITKDVYDTVCAFSNRDGGVILLGVSCWVSATTERSPVLRQKPSIT